MRLLQKIIAKFKALLYYPFFFHRYGKRSLILKPLHLNGISNIEVGDRVFVQEHTWLACVPIEKKDNAKLILDDGAVIGHFNHIYATQSIVIGKHVLTADKVYITDNLHQYEDINTPILQQSIKQLKSVSIGDGSWLGENVCVIGASIGKNCVIGANSVVTHDIPDYSVAVGVPARIIKKYNFDTETWEKVN
ncbi:MAG: acyltransferase [Paludibacteraceae bacterium]|nr:acyltransferase [Paludibacteraceae bacterium]